MSNKNTQEIASAIRTLLISEHGYQVEDVYIRKWISDNYGIGFFHDDEYPLCMSVCHHDEKDFSPRQRKVIKEVLNREEFLSKYNEPDEGNCSDGKPEIWTKVKIKSFDGWENEDIAKWIVSLYCHFIDTVTLLELT